MSDNKGVLISFEGMEGAGKTTVCEWLAEKFQTQGKESVVVREPGGVRISEEIRKIVLSPDYPEIAVTTEVLLFQAARAQLYAEIVLPNLKEGKMVLMDRTRDSSLIYQGIARKIGKEWIEQLSDYSTQGTLPNLTFLLDLPANVGLERRAKLGKLDRIELEGLGFQEMVCQAYREVATQDKSGRWVIIDASPELENVQNEIWKIVHDTLKI